MLFLGLVEGRTCSIRATLVIVYLDLLDDSIRCFLNGQFEKFWSKQKNQVEAGIFGLDFEFPTTSLDIPHDFPGHSPQLPRTLSTTSPRLSGETLLSAREFDSAGRHLYMDKENVIAIIILLI
jgi:hypothetical protein